MYKKEEFWGIVANLKWDGNYIRCSRELNVNYSEVEILRFEKNVSILMNDLDTRFGEYAIPCGDDGWSDIRAEIIARGKKFYDTIGIKKIYLMANNTDYNESFLYIFH